MPQALGGMWLSHREGNIMKNFYDILKNVCLLAHEETPSSFLSDEEPYNELKQHIKNTLEEVCSRFPWTFRERKHVFSTVAAQREYSLPAGAVVSNMLKNGVRINDYTSPLYFVPHEELDMLLSTSGKPYRYSVFSGELILDPVPDDVYTVQIKYLTTHFASDNSGVVTKPNLELESDICIIPDRYAKTLEWGAYSSYRGNFKPDEKYKSARDHYLQYLGDMQKQDGYGDDNSPALVIANNLDFNDLLLRGFRDSRV